jgi:S-layer protein (TIGR01567 family)
LIQQGFEVEAMAIRMRPKLAAIAVIVIVSCFFGITDGLEIRSKVVPAINGSYRFSANGGEIGSSGTLSLGFHGFYYDIDDDLGNEEIRINVNKGKIDGKERPEGLIYRTAKESKRFRFRDWGQYFTMGFMGENYFAGYNGISSNGRVPYLYQASHDKDIFSSQMLLKVLIDEDTELVFSDRDPLQLKDGYKLMLDEIGPSGDRAYLKLLRNGVEVANGTIDCSSNDEKDRIFKYTNDFSNVDDLVILAVHFDKFFSRETLQLAQIDGIFQLSEDPKRIDVGSKYGVLTVLSTDSNSIEMANRDETITLRQGIDLPIIGRIRLRTADPEEDSNKALNMYIYSNIIDPGTYEVRGPKDEIMKGKIYIWDYNKFPGFMYDLDRNLGTEELIIQSSGDYENGDARLRSLVYRTKARESRIKLDEWGSYYLIGFMGEKYFAGYADDESRLSLASISGDDETNLLSLEKLSKVLIDSDEQFKPYAIGKNIRLQEGYVLKIKNIDSERIILDLEKNNFSLDVNHIVNMLGNEDCTYTYRAPIGLGNKLVTLAVHFKNTFNSNMASLATIDGIWQISDNLTPIEYGSSSGLMKIMETEISPGKMILKMESKDKTIRAAKGRNESIMGDYFIRFADQDDEKPLRFYVMKNVIVSQGDTS